MKRVRVRRGPWITAVLAVAGMLTAGGCSPARSEIAPPAGFVDLSRVMPDAVFDIRYAGKNNFTGEVLDGYRAPRAFMRPRSAGALLRVHKALAARGLRLKIFDTYRPLRATRHMIRWARRTGNERLLGSYLSSRARVKRRTGHECGNTADLTLVDSSGRELDMGTPFDEFTRRANTKNAKGRVLRNRLLLKKYMEAEGFRNYSLEWWHYVYARDPGPARDDVIR